MHKLIKSSGLDGKPPLHSLHSKSPRSLDHIFLSKSKVGIIARSLRTHILAYVFFSKNAEGTTTVKVDPQVNSQYSEDPPGYKRLGKPLKLIIVKVQEDTGVGSTSRLA